MSLNKTKKRRISSSPSSPSINNKDDNDLYYTEEFYKLFDKKKVLIKQTGKEKYNNILYITYSAYFIDAETKNKCFEILIAPTYIQIKGIKYVNETNCVLSGNHILEKLEIFSKNIGIFSISLSDGSYIYIDDTQFYNLSTYYILLHGISWYNSRGYISDKFKKEIIHNKKIINRPLNSIKKINKNKDYEKLIIELKSYNIHDTDTLNNIAIQLDNLRKRGIHDFELMKTIKDFVDIVKQNNILEYNMSLRKELSTSESKTLSHNKNTKTISHNKTSKTLSYNKVSNIIKTGGNSIDSIIYHYFNKDKIINISRDEKIYYGYYANASDRHECFKFTIVDEERMIIYGIKYENEINCILSGSSILNNLIDLSKKLGLKQIKLFDASRIYRKDATSISDSYPLYYYYILLKGISWYNSQGFYSLNYNTEKEYNEQIRKTIFKNISLKDITVITRNKVKKYEEKKLQLEEDKNNIIKLLKKYNIYVDDTTTIHDIMISINSRRDELFDVIIELINFAINYNLIIYNQDLIMNL
jgi:hypothetical protein